MSIFATGGNVGFFLAPVLAGWLPPYSAPSPRPMALRRC